jgi:ribosomal protein S27AE
MIRRKRWRDDGLHPGREDGSRPRLIMNYLMKGYVRLIAVDVNVEDVTIGVFKVWQLIKIERYIRVRRPIGKILFVRKVNRYSMKVHRRPASSWLRYARNVENDWINKTVGLIKKMSKRVDAVIVEELSTKQLKASLKSKDPEKSLLFSSWPVAKILRRIKAFAEKKRKLFTIPPQYTSRVCPRCNSMMKHEKRRWDRLVCRCGFRDDRDNVAVRNIARTALILSGFHYLNTVLGKQLREYKQAIDKLTPKISRALTQGPEIGPDSWEGKGREPSPSTPEDGPSGYAWVRAPNEPFSMNGCRRPADTPAASLQALLGG